ncbi:MAG TPA: hypothetical protein VIN67_07805, partial [Desulfobaccales bacterium]
PAGHPPQPNYLKLGAALATAVKKRFWGLLYPTLTHLRPLDYNKPCPHHRASKNCENGLHIIKENLYEG